MSEGGTMGEREAAEWNAVAWLSLTDDELIERSASLGLPGDLHPNPTTPGAREATRKDVAKARKAADGFARDHAGAKFVTRWIKENRA